MSESQQDLQGNAAEKIAITEEKLSKLVAQIQTQIESEQQNGQYCGPELLETVEQTKALLENWLEKQQAIATSDRISRQSEDRLFSNIPDFNSGETASMTLEQAKEISQKLDSPALAQYSDVELFQASQAIAATGDLETAEYLYMASRYFYMISRVRRSEANDTDTVHF